jgi:Protein of unknown function (DUF620)
MHLRRHLTLPMLVAASVCSAAWAASDQPLPKAEDILDKFVGATGGKANYEKIHNEKSTGTFEFVGKGIKGIVTSWRAEPNKSLTTVELQGVGTIQEGSDGQTAWESSSLQGPRIKQGEERAFALRDATLRAPLYWRKLYKHVETVGQETIDGQPCYKVVLTPEEGKPETQYYDKTTGLMVKMTVTVTRPEGDIATETIFSDYKDEDGLRQPHKVREIAMDQEFMVTVDHVDYNVDIPANQFDLPAGVKALAPK